MSVVNYLNAAGAKSGKDERVEYYKKFFGEDGGDAKFSWVWNERLHKELLVRYGTDKAKLAADTRRILEGQEPETPAPPMSAPARTARPKNTAEAQNETPEIKARREAAEGREREYTDAVFYQMQDPAEAVKKVKQAPPNDGKVHILDIPGTPPKVANPKAWDKKYAFIHGGCNYNDKSLIWTGAESGNFAYCVTTQGWVCRFWPDGLGQGAIGPKGMVNGDADAAFHGIGIEFSAKKSKTIEGEAEEPNDRQRLAGKGLLKFLAHKYPGLQYSTSWKAVDGEFDVHGDTRTWGNQVYADMGIDPNALLERMPANPHALGEAGAQALATRAQEKADQYAAKGDRRIAASWRRTAENAKTVAIEIAQANARTQVVDAWSRSGTRRS